MSEAPGSAILPNVVFVERIDIHAVTALVTAHRCRVTGVRVHDTAGGVEPAVRVIWSSTPPTEAFDPLYRPNDIRITANPRMTRGALIGRRARYRRVRTHRRAWWSSPILGDRT